MNFIISLMRFVSFPDAVFLSDFFGFLEQHAKKAAEFVPDGKFGTEAFAASSSVTFARHRSISRSRTVGMDRKHFQVTACDERPKIFFLEDAVVHSCQKMHIEQVGVQSASRHLILRMDKMQHVGVNEEGVSSRQSKILVGCGIF